MTGERAGQVVAILTAAFPDLSLEPEAARLWTKLLSELDDGDIAEGVALDIARHSTRPPTIATFREAYVRAVEQSRQRRALPERSAAPLTEQERAENLRRVRELQDRLGLSLRTP